jgi:hypothetical protein
MYIYIYVYIHIYKLTKADSLDSLHSLSYVTGRRYVDMSLFSFPFDIDKKMLTLSYSDSNIYQSSLYSFQIYFRYISDICHPLFLTLHRYKRHIYYISYFI